MTEGMMTAENETKWQRMLQALSMQRNTMADQCAALYADLVEERDANAKLQARVVVLEQELAAATGRTVPGVEEQGNGKEVTT
jgi:hypothetical protein